MIIVHTTTRMTENMSTCMNTVITLCFMSYLVLVSGEGEMGIIRERLQRLETRMTEELALLRREFYQGLDTDAGVNARNDKGTVSTVTPNHLVRSFESEIEYLEQNVMNKLRTIRDGIAVEKRLRRNIQSDIQSLRNVDTINAQMLASGCENISRILEVLPALKKLQYEVEVIAKSVKTDTTSRAPRVSDCTEWLRMGRTTSGVYTVFPESMWRPLNVYCDMETDGGGWTVFQRRMDGSEDFYRNWIDYTFGFGNLSGEFWLGNEFLHRLTSNAPYELRIDMEDFENDTRVAKYGLFSVGPRSEGFILTVEFFTGNVTDSLIRRHHKQQFSTYDVGPASSSCSEKYKGGWWYEKCHSVNLNGLYHIGKHESFADGINWYDWKGYHYSLKKTDMKFRPR